MDFIFAGIRHNFPGMLTEREGEFLADMCRDKFVLELGSYTGMSTISIARTARHVVACDWHGGDAHIGAQDTLAQLNANLRRYEVRDKVTLLVGTFDVTLPLLSRAQFDVVYIDGAYDYDSVSHDTIEAERLIKNGGVMIWHDANNPKTPGVGEFLANEMKDPNSFFTPITFGPDRIAWAMFRN